MQIKSNYQNTYKQSFGALKTEKMSKYCRNIIREKILPKINENLINELDDMGYDIVFKKGNSIEGKEFDIFLFDRERNFSHYVENIDFDKKIETLCQKKLKELSKSILECFIRMNNKN